MRHRAAALFERLHLPFTRTVVPLSVAGGAVRVHLLEHGDRGGPPVLFLHGNRSWSITWRRVMQLCGGHRLLAPDLPGLGLSDPLPRSRRTVAGYADVVVRLLERLEVSTAVFVAHEVGAVIAAAVDARAPGLLAGGVLVSSAVMRTPSHPEPTTLHRHGRALRLRDVLFAAIGRPRLPLEALQTRRDEFASECAELYEWPLTRSRRRSMRELAALAADARARAATEDRVLSFPGPLALVWAHRDPLMRPEQLAAQERELPYARIWRTEAGHFAQEEEPERVADAISWVLERVGRPADDGIPANFLPGIGPGDFTDVGRAQVRFFVEQGGLLPTDAVLDVGCGLGRTALALRDFLAPSGRYVGVDVVRDVVRWCQQNVTRVDRRMEFRHIPVRNDLYSEEGLDARSFRFPFEDRSFDFVIADSLFTHLDAEESRHYLGEIARVLRTGGTLWMSAFLLDEPTRRSIEAGRADRRFATRRGGEWVDDPSQPLLAVAFERDWLLDAIRGAGLTPGAPVRGAWRGGASPLYLDVAVARRRE